MHPVLFTVFGFPVPSYGTMLALSFLVGIFFSAHVAKKRGLDQDAVSNVGLLIIISAIIGARLYYVATHFHEFRGNLLSIVNPVQSDGSFGISGLVMYGGFIAAIVTTSLFFWLKKLPVLPYLDTYAPGVGFGIALTRIGCFLNGCCYGAATKVCNFMSINYPRNSPAGYHQFREDACGLLPSQFFESAGGIAIAVILILVGRSKKYFAGLQFYLLVTLYAVLRFFVEMTRFIEVPKIGPFSHNQIICMILFPVFAGLILRGLTAEKNIADSEQVKINKKSNKSN